MGKITLSIGLGVFAVMTLSTCWRDAPKLPKVGKTKYCFSPTNDYSSVISSNGFYSFYYPAGSASKLNSKLKAADYTEKFILYPSGELYTFLSTDTTYGLMGQLLRRWRYH